MADKKISQLSSGTNAQAGDLFVIARSGANYSLTTAQLFNAPSATATLGGLAVDTNTLFVDAANDRVGIGTATPAWTLDVQSPTARFKLQSTTGTNAAYLWATNGGGDFYFGRDSSTGAALGTNTPYSAVLFSANAYPMVFFTNTVERMRIDANGRLGIGATSPSASLHVERPSTDNVIAAIGQSGYEGALYLSGAGSGKDTAIVVGNGRHLDFRGTATTTPTTSGTLFWRIAGGTGHLLTGADATYDIGASGANRPRDLFIGRNAAIGGDAYVGIGYAGASGLSISPAGNLSFAETVGISYVNIFRQSNSAGTVVANGYKYSNTANGFASSVSALWARSAIRLSAGGIQFYTDPASTVANGTDITPTLRAALDSAGNLGLGVTPQAWSTRALEIIGGIGISSVTGLDFTLNAYYNAGWLYRATGAATRYEQASGQHRWYNASSGTAGNAITFTQAMTLDASGRLMVGTTSPSGLVTVSQNQNAATTVAVLNADAGSSASSRLTLDTVGGGGYVEVRRTGGAMVFNVSTADRWQISQSGHLLAGADATYDIGASGATRPRDVFIARDLNVDGGTLYVDATNNRVGIGTTSPVAPLHVATTGSQLITVLESTSEIGWRFLRSGVGNQLFGRDSASRFAWVDGLDFSATYLMALTTSANLGLGTTSFGTSATKVLAIGSGTEPSTGPADTVQFYSVDRSAGNTIPGLRCEGNGVTDAGITDTTVTHKIAMKVNGTVYYLLATTNAT